MSENVSVRGDSVVESSAGAVLLCVESNVPQALLIRVRRAGFEVPKGHVEPGETAAQAAIRELHEETGLRSAVVAGAQVGEVGYSFEKAGKLIHKRVTYFAAVPDPQWDCEFGDKPGRTREIRWVTQADLDDVPVVNENLRPIVANAFATLE